MTLRSNDWGFSNAIDLDAIEDPTWGGDEQDCPPMDFNVRDAGPNTTVEACGDATLLAVSADAPLEYKTCATTGYTSSVPGDKIRRDLQICAHTGDGRYSMMRVLKSVPPSGSNGVKELQLSLTTWEQQTG